MILIFYRCNISSTPVHRIKINKIELTFFYYLQNRKTHLKLLNNIMNKHTNQELLQTCSKTLLILSTGNIPVYSNIIDDYIANYQNAIDYWHNSVGNNDMHYNVDDFFNIIVSLRKLTILYNHHNLPWHLFENLYKLIDEYYHLLTVDKEKLPMIDEVMCKF